MTPPPGDPSYSQLTPIDRKTPLRVSLLGLPRIELQDEPAMIERRKAIALLAYLAAERGAVVRREVLAALLSPHHDEARAYAELRRAIAALKSAGIGDWIEVERATLTLRREGCWVDLWAFDTLTAEGSVDALEEALSLFRGEFLDGFYLRDNPDFEEWRSLHARLYQQRQISTLERLINLYQSAEKTALAHRTVERLLAVDPLNEREQQRAMLLLAAMGQPVAALKQYEHLTARLSDELGVTPQPETTVLYEQIKAAGGLPTIQQAITSAEPAAGDAAQGWLPRVPSMVVGRDEALRDVKQRIGLGEGEGSRDHQRMVIIQGWPGVGKSTLVGLLAHDAQVRQSFTDGVLMVALGEQPEIISALQSLALRLGTPLDTLQRMTTPDDLAGHLRSLLADKHALLIVDDVFALEHVAPFMVAGTRCAVVFTSRFNGIAQALAPRPDAVYKLSVLSETQALELLGALSPAVIEQYPQEARELVRDLEGLPLAIQVAGRLLNAEANLGWSIKELLNELREGTRLLSAEAPADLVDIESGTTPTIGLLLQKSTDRLDAELRERFAYLGIFAPKPATFDLDAISAVWAVADPRPMIRQLVSRGLLEPISGKRFQMHALLVMHARTLFTD